MDGYNSCILFCSRVTQQDSILHQMYTPHPMMPWWCTQSLTMIHCMAGHLCIWTRIWDMVHRLVNIQVSPSDRVLQIQLFHDIVSIHIFIYPAFCRISRPDPYCCLIGHHMMHGGGGPLPPHMQHMHPGSPHSMPMSHMPSGPSRYMRQSSVPMAPPHMSPHQHHAPLPGVPPSHMHPQGIII